MPARKKPEMMIAEAVEANPFDNETFAAKTSTTRSNKSATIVRSDRFKNIEDGLIPFKYSTSGYGKGSSDGVEIRDAVILCQKAYYNFAVFRNTIDLMTEFSINNIYFEGGTQKSRDFLQAYFDKINLWSIQDRFFREYYRSGNVFVYRFDANFKPEEITRMTQVFGQEDYSRDTKLPIKYSILNPADIILGGNINFSNPLYYKVLSDYELERLKNPQTEEDVKILQNFDKVTIDKIKSKNASMITIPLKGEKVSAVFFKKQDYEPFAVPMGYPVLEDINAKAELKKMDMAIARTMQQIVLLVTTGNEPDKGGVNPKNLAAIQKIFNNKSVGRVLVADYTTKAEFVIPTIGDLLDPKKYDVIDRDITMGLSSVLVGDQKFANESIKVQVFIERLKQAREVFLNEFLIHEVKRICKTLGFKNYPTPRFEDIDLKDSAAYGRVYNRLIELGILTPEEGLTAIETGRLPNKEDSVKNQVEFKGYKDSGLYEPLIGGKNRAGNQAGRPEDTTQIQQEVPRESAEGAAEISLKKLKEIVLASSHIQSKVEKEILAISEKKRVSKAIKEQAESILEIIIANEDPENWESSIGTYVRDPVDKNQERVRKVYDIAAEYDLDTYTASILLAAQKEKQ
jgi:hypothetical protein